MASEISTRSRIVHDTTTGKFFVINGTASNSAISVQTSESAAETQASTYDTTGGRYTYPPRGNRKS